MLFHPFLPPIKQTYAKRLLNKEEARVLVTDPPYNHQIIVKKKRRSRFMSLNTKWIPS